MKRRICFILRKHGDSPSIERVFDCVSRELIRQGFEVLVTTLPYGNSFAGLLANLLFFRPPEANIFHITGHVHYIALALNPDRTVLTVHDFGILRSRRKLRRYVIKKLFFDWPLRRLKYITSVSEATLNEAIAISHCDQKKIRVIENPLCDDVLPMAPTEFNAEKPLLLQIGTAPHKNVEKVIDAIGDINCRLLIIGNLDDQLRTKLERSKIQYENLPSATQLEIESAYRNCDIVVFCSTFEGFGLPIIEAQAMRKPLITSNIPPMNDVAGSGALLVDPSDPEQIREAILRLIADKPLRDSLVENGLRNTKRFDRATIAAKYRSLYEEILQGQTTLGARDTTTKTT